MRHERILSDLMNRIGEEPLRQLIAAIKDANSNYGRMKDSTVIKHLFHGSIPRKTICTAVNGLDGPVDRTLVLVAVMQSAKALIYAKQDPETCLEAVRATPWALRYVRRQTPEMCLEAVRQNGWTLRDVEEQTEEICLAAVREQPHSIEFVRDKTVEIRRLAAQDGSVAISRQRFLDVLALRRKADDNREKGTERRHHGPSAVQDEGRTAAAPH